MLISFRQLQSRLPSDGLDLKYFLLQAKLMSLYRKTLRETRCLGTNEVRRETIAWVRHEFKKSAIKATNEAAMRELIAQFNRQFKQLRSQSMLIGGQFEKLRG
ncbi:hypothetical protein O181_061314, partial [Austropuccinia psidii MF-1]|nr:hypothetical protein [Austropuccinia psidii MF-1]